MRVQFSTLGTSPEVVLNALRHVPMDEIHLFTDRNDASEVIEIEKFYTNKPLEIAVYTHVVDKFDLMDSILVMIEAIKTIQKKYQEIENLDITLNMTGGTKIMTSAMLLVGYMTATRVFYIKKLREDRGIGELIWIPMPRVAYNEIKGPKLEMIKALGIMDIPISLTRLKNSTSLKSIQAMSRYIQYFEDENLISSEYKGKERRVILTNTGRILAAMIE